MGRLPIFVWSGRRRRQESPGTIDGTVAVESVRCAQLLAYLRTNAVSVDFAELAVDVAVLGFGEISGLLRRHSWCAETRLRAPE